MNNIFSKKMKSKSDKELFFILNNRHSYQNEALDAAINELNNRGLVNEFSHVLNETAKELIIEKSNIIKKSKSDFSWLPKTHFYDLIGYYSLLFITLIVLSFSFFDEYIFWAILMFGIIIPLWQSNTISSKSNRRSYQFISRVIYTFSFIVILETRKYFLFNDISSISNIFINSLIILILSGLVSIPFCSLKTNLLRARKYYILNYLRPFVWIAGIFLLLLIILENGWLNPHIGEKIKWDDKRPLTFEHFNGYPDLFTKYDAAILANIEYEFDDLGNLKYLDAICHTDQTWVNPWNKNSYFLLQHERYHFNITEMVTRMARKKVLDTINDGAEKKGIEKIINDHIVKLKLLQIKYDSETDHSLVLDKQSQWQYHIDSTLAELDSYWTSDILAKVDTTAKLQFFRNININDKMQITGINRLMAGERQYTDHYEFIYSNEKKLIQIHHLFQGSLKTDDVFGAAIININQISENEIVWTFFDLNNRPILCKNGYFKQRMYLTKENIAIQYYDIDDNKVLNKEGVHAVRLNLDKIGRQKERIFFNNSGRQIINSMGWYLRKYSYKGKNDYAYLIENYNSKNKALEDINGAFQINIFYDNNHKSLSYRNKNKKNISVNGYYYKKEKYNELGYHVSTTNEYKNQQLFQDENGIGKYSWSFDRYGNINRQSFYNSNNVLTLNKQGVATSYHKYDSKNNLLEESEYDTGEILIYDDAGYGKVEYKYDSLNRIRYLTNLNGYDYPITSYQGGAIELYFYDSLNRHIGSRFLDEHFQADTSRAGSAFYKYEYDVNNNVIESKHFDLNNNLVAVIEDVSTFKYIYDDNNNKLETSYYTVDGRRASANQGASINEYIYSDNNMLVERAYYDTLKRLIKFDGNAIIKWIYDVRGNEIETYYFNENGLPLDSGIAVTKNFYDTKNNLIVQKQYYDQEKGINTNSALVKLGFDEAENVIDVFHFDQNERPVVDMNFVHHYKYNYDRGIFSGESYYDKYRQLTKKDGIAQSEIKIDERGNAVIETTYDEFHKIIEDSTGVAIEVNGYDAYDRIVFQSFYDSDMKMILRNGVYAIIKYTRDKSGNVIEKSYYNLEGSLIENEEKVSLYTFRYDRNGRMVEKKSYNLKDAENFTENLSSEFIATLNL